MISKTIPTPNNPSLKQLPVGHSIQKESDRLLFSFALLESNEYFDLSGSCDSWSSDLFVMLKEVSKVSLKELLNYKYKKYRFHSHKNANPPCKMPENIPLENSYQLRISKSKGGIHGVLVEDVFYVFWLDPLHNMYPDDNYGGAIKISPLRKCCLEIREQLNEINEKNKELEEENNALHELFDNAK